MGSTRENTFKAFDVEINANDVRRLVVEAAERELRSGRLSGSNARLEALRVRSNETGGYVVTLLPIEKP